LRIIIATLTIINKPYAQLFYHEETGIVHHHLTAELNSANLKEVLFAGNELLRKHHATKWLSDNRFMQAHAEEDADWIGNQWLPQAIEFGWKYWALVVPQSWHARNNLVDYVNLFHDMGVRVMVFTDVDPAMAWLLKIDKQPAKR